MDQLDIAIHQSAHGAAGGLEGLAQRLGKNTQVLRNKVCPTTEQNVLSLREAVAIILDTGDTRILEEMARIVGGRFVPGASSDKPMTLMEAFIASQGEVADVTHKMVEALADGQITPREAAEIKHETADARAALARLDDAVTLAADTRRGAGVEFVRVAS